MTKSPYDKERNSLYEGQEIRKDESHLRLRIAVNIALESTLELFIKYGGALVGVVLYK